MNKTQNQSSARATAAWRSQAWLAVAVSTAVATISAASIAAPPASLTTKQQRPAAKKASPSGSALTTTQPINGDNTPLTEEQKILHALNRLGYGPRPGDVDRVRKIGLKAYIEQQLQPEKVADTAVETKLADFDILRAGNGELADAYRNNIQSAIQMRQAMQGNMPKPASGDDAMMAPAAGSSDRMPDAQKVRRKRMEALQALKPEERAKLMEKMQGKEARKNVQVTSAVQLTIAKVVRATESERQLQEVLVDFWGNHFNVDMRKALCRVYKVTDDRDTIRANYFSKFRTLLGASAKSPAMLVYLDNAQSSVPREIPANIQRRMENGATNKKILQRARGGINENYAREIMELHTLGVEGGYSQKDVTEVARCLTGWGLRNGEFYFDARRHDNGAKVVLGNTIPAGGGQQDGEMVLDILANHENTMRYVSRRLCQKLVADEPPAGLVDKCVSTWKRTNGDLREIVRTIVLSPEFFSRAAYRQKIKSPFEYAISSVRALGGTVATSLVPGGQARYAAMREIPGNAMRDAARNGIAAQVATMGEPLFQCQPPTGYPVDSRKWVSTGALIARLNFALRLTDAKVVGVDLESARQIVPTGTPLTQSVNYLGDALLYGELTPSTRATLLKEAKASEANKEKVGTRRIAALLLGSPEFQRH